jgi:hypothetical protein
MSLLRWLTRNLADTEVATHADLAAQRLAQLRQLGVEQREDGSREQLRDPPPADRPLHAPFAGGAHEAPLDQL